MATTRSALHRAAQRSGVRDAAVLAALDVVDRRAFVLAETADLAEVDVALPLTDGQTTSQPSLVALMLESLHLAPTGRVLEVGTGHGYEAALLSELAGEVWTVERIATLAECAASNLADRPRVHVVVGDGSRGLPEHAPYDAIVIAARTERVPDALAAQLRTGGRLVAPIGGDRVQRCLVHEKQDDGSLRRVADPGEVLFVPLTE